MHHYVFLRLDTSALANAFLKGQARPSPAVPAPCLNSQTMCGNAELRECNPMKFVNSMPRGVNIMSGKIIINDIAVSYPSGGVGM